MTSGPDCRPITPAPTQAMLANLTQVKEVPFNWPRILPSGWREDPIQRGTNRAVYRHQRGLLVLCSSSEELDGRNWLHVSFSYANRMPSYDDLQDVKRLFIGTERTAYQIFPPEKKYVNHHPYCLHLWALHDKNEAATPDFTRGNGMV